ncbi:FYVE zinc finger-domain-containing protein [Mycena maculata]|uniref:FYVE zinc finger-domain-containing protein n=1 Tax=Mycena maculata TaxID=230809 RepID=A0AAD7IBZ7_9AGAR|nr:FYVE zinc finger-domain-containing protein [Mycena maculata]
MSEPAPSLPYQAYKSKRHSQTSSNPQARYAATNVSPPATSRPSSLIAPTTPPPTQTSQNGYSSWEKEAQTSFNFSKSPQSPPLPVIVLDPSPPVSNGLPSPPVSLEPPQPSEPMISQLNDPSPEPARVNGTHSYENGAANGSVASGSALTQSPPQTPADLPSTSAAASSSSASATIPEDRPRKTSTFRRVQRNARTPLPSSPLAGGGHARTVSSSSMTSSSLRPSLPPSEHPSQRPTSMLMDPRHRIQSLSLSPSTNERPPAVSSLPEESSRNWRYSMPLNADAVAASLTTVGPPARTSSLTAQPVSPPMSRVPSSIPSRQTTPAPTPSSAPPSPSTLTPPRQASAPYRPGFQPKGVYRPRTDEFIAHRKAHAVSAGYASAERTKLERRLEKLVALHFTEEEKVATGPGVGRRPGLAPTANTNRRASSFFDLDLKSILGGGGGKEDVRTAEQRITPWQEDSSVSKCPLCTTNFHPLTNRKHHCRLCGQIICALPIKRPQRPQLCSVLFIVDPKTRNIEEVGEGVDYGVRKRRTSSVGGAKELQEEAAEEEKFLRGVRICRECRPVLLRQQHHQQNMHVPTFVKLYETFVILEKEIEDSLPQFQELILTLNHDSQPNKEASAARKRLLEAFAQYDSLAKRIRNLATPNGRGSSQERVQIAVMTRANLFLQKNMFPLQSLPTPKNASAAARAAAIPVEDDDDGSYIDPSSATALALQPLLEQEALLETFVEEAKAQRKFEDAKTLRVNLGEIRAEIESVLTAEGLKGKRARKG